MTYDIGRVAQTGRASGTLLRSIVLPFTAGCVDCRSFGYTNLNVEGSNPSSSILLSIVRYG